MHGALHNCVIPPAPTGGGFFMRPAPGRQYISTY